MRAPKDMAHLEKPPDLFRLAIDQTRDYAMFLLDVTGHIRSWNLGAARIKGYHESEILGKHFSIFYTRDAVESGWPQHELKVAGAEGRFEDEGWRVRKDGSRFWANVIITALRGESGELLGFSKITRDLTERRLQEEALRQSEERFRLLVEGVIDYAVFMLDTEGLVTSWNAGAQRIKGYSRDEVLGRSYSRFYTEEDIRRNKPWESLATAKRLGRAEEEGWRVKKNGDRFWARAVITPLRDSEGRLRGYAKVTQDLTDRRHIQELESAALHVNEFIAVLAHELRNPLAPIRNAVQLMAATPAGSPANVSMLGIIDRQSAHLSRIVDDLVDISRITRGKLQVERVPVELGAVVRRAVETSAPLVQAARHTLEVDVPLEPLMVTGDASRLNQLLTNLLNNAARYTPERGKIWVQARAEGANAVVRVRDTGVGIQKELLGRVFDMFLQGQGPLQRVGGGLGVGLALARQIAQLHQGTLVANSEGENAGSEFVLTLPLAEALPQGADRPAQGPGVERAAAPRRILVVDDNVDAADTLHLLLTTLGHDARVVHDGHAALQVAPEFRPDVILLDIGMPGLDGYEVARRLGELRKQHDFRIVAITGWGQEMDRQKSREAGFDQHLVKPVDINTLAGLLHHSAAVH